MRPGCPQEGRGGWQCGDREAGEGERRGEREREERERERERRRGQDWQGAVWSGNRSFWITQTLSIQLESCSLLRAGRIWRGSRFESREGTNQTAGDSGWCCDSFPGQERKERERNHNTATWISVTTLSLFNSLTHQIDFEPVCLNTRTLQPCTLTVDSVRRRERTFPQLGSFCVLLFLIFFYFVLERLKTFFSFFFLFGVLMVPGAAEVPSFFNPSFSDVMSRLSRTMESGTEPGRYWLHLSPPGADPLPPGRCGSPSSFSPPLCVPWSSSSHLPRRAAGRGGGTARGGSRRSSSRSPTSSSAPTSPRRPWEPAGDPRARLRATPSALKSWRRITTQILSSRMRRTRAPTGSWHR